MSKQEEMREGILHEICCICVHKATAIEDGLFKDSPKTLHGLGCTYRFDEESSQYCSLAYKVLNAILRKLDSQGMVLKVEGEWDIGDTDTHGFPCNPLCHNMERKLLKEAGYSRTEPLVKEGD